jgi:hypothetical protein
MGVPSQPARQRQLLLETSTTWSPGRYTLLHFGSLPGDPQVSSIAHWLRSPVAPAVAHAVLYHCIGQADDSRFWDVRPLRSRAQHTYLSSMRGTRAVTRPLFVAIAAVLTLATIAVGPAFGDATTQTTVVRTPVSEIVTGLICVDDPVFLTGYLQTTFHITDNATGGLTIVQTSSAQDVHGTGLTTGQEYRTVGPPYNNTISYSSSGSSVATSTNEAEGSIIGQGQPDPGPVFRIRITEHTTVNANGDVTAQISQYSEEVSNR